jgi:hypothetical protein
MNTSLIIRACLLGLLVLLLLLAWHFVKHADDGVKLIFFILVGAGGGLWATKYFIPWFGEILEQVVAHFPNTRHSANAHHRINELDQMKYKQTTEQRIKSRGDRPK